MNYDASEILMRSLAGLGIFFFGIKMITRNLGAMAGDQFRRGLHGASERLGIAIVFGAIAGFVTQSGRTTSFIMASFVQAGLIQVRRALPIVIWANLGCTLVIFSAVFPVYLFALFLLATAGACLAFERPKPLLNAASAAFGLALMLFGLQMTSSSTAVLTDFHWFATALAIIKMSLAFAFLTGLLLTFVAQSHIAITLIAITMAGRGIFAFDQTLMVIYGALAGSSLITYVTGIHFRGEPRQVVTGQILYSLIGLVLFLTLFVGEHMIFGRSAVFGALDQHLALGPGASAALVAVIFNIVTPLLLTLALPAFHRLCVRLAPPSGDEDLGRPLFLRDEVANNAMAVLLLAEKEQLRLLRRLPAYCAWSRGEASARAGTPPAVYHHAFGQVSKHIGRFHAALMSERMTAEDTEWLLNQQKRLESLVALDAVCHELCELSDDMGDTEAHLRDAIVESLDTLLLTAIDGMAKGDDQELGYLVTMTRDRGPAMERMRKQYLAASDSLSPAARNHILQVTSLFERASWSLNRFGTLLREAPGTVLEIEQNTVPETGHDWETGGQRDIQPAR
jgi:phosphate:Na+ symporter